MAARFFAPIVLAAAIASCAQGTGRSVDSDEFSMAARSWLGAYVEDMLAAWPNPNMRCGSNTIGESGCVWWRHRQDNTPGGDIQFDYRCEAIVRYNEAGVITEVDVRQSSNCHRRYGDQLQRMRRDTSPEVSATIEDLK